MKTLLIVIGFILSGCASSAFISDKENVWVMYRKQPYFCKANLENKMGAAPVCYPAKDAQELNQ